MDSQARASAPAAEHHTEEAAELERAALERAHAKQLEAKEVVLVQDEKGRWQVGAGRRWELATGSGPRCAAAAAARAARRRCPSRPPTGLRPPRAPPARPPQVVKLRKLNAASRSLLLSRVYRGGEEDEGLGFFQRVRERLDRRAAAPRCALCAAALRCRALAAGGSGRGGV